MKKQLWKAKQEVIFHNILTLSKLYCHFISFFYFLKLFYKFDQIFQILILVV